MKILHLIDHNGLGGAQTVVRGIFESQKDNRDIFLYVLRSKNKNVSIDHKNVFSNTYLKYSLAPLFDLVRLIRKERTDILHCHLFKSQIVGWLLKLLYFKDIRLVFHEHGKIVGSDTENKISNRFYIFFLKVVKNKVNVFIAISNFVKRELVRKVKINMDKVIVLYNFVDLNKFTRKSITRDTNLTDFVVGFAGRLVERKGWKDFVNAAHALSKDNKNIKFIIAGTGPQQSKLTSSIKLDKNIKYLGYVTDMVQFYSLLDCFVIPSHWEPMGLTELEAQAMGVPIIASNVDGLNEIVSDNENAVLFTPKDIESLKEKIELVFNNINLRTKLINNGFDDVKKYSLYEYLLKLNKIYE